MAEAGGKKKGSVWVLDGPTADIREKYTFGRKIGQPGQYGYAVMGHLNAEPAQKVAIKVIAKARFLVPKKQYVLQEFRREMEIMQNLEHPNIIRFIEAFEDSANFYIVMELCDGGELFDRITQLGRYSEKDAAGIFRQLLLGLQYIHSEKKIAHCDLKPDNFIFETKADDATVKIIDFGMAKHLKRRQYFQEFAGTSYYVAPEVLDGKYTEACDMWSMGVVLFVMVYGFPPFYADPAQYGAFTDQRIYQKIRKGFDPIVKNGYGAHFPSAISASEEARDLITRLLNSDMKVRYTATEALEHPWVNGGALDDPIDPKVVNGLRDFQKSTRLKKLVLKLMVHSLERDEVLRLRSTFRNMDADGDGVLTHDELKRAMEQLEHGEVADAEVERIIAVADMDGDGVISFPETELAYTHRKLNMQEERLYESFCELDLNKDNKVTADELQQVFHAEGKDEVAAIMREVDVDGDGCINFDEFIEHWRDDAERTSFMEFSEMQGYLQKLGGFIRNWKKRWFAVSHRAHDASQLCYFNNKADSEHGTRAKGRIDLAGARMAIFDDDVYNKPYTFGITPANKSRTYVLVCASDAERTGWMNHLRYHGVTLDPPRSKKF